MVNQQQFTEIPLSGRGYQRKPAGRYGAGEYSHLRNTEITNDGYLINRAPVMTGQVATELPIRNPQRFIGYVGNYMMFLAAESMFAVDASSGVRYTCAQGPLQMNMGAGYADSSKRYERIIKIVEYNKWAYMLTFATRTNGTWEVRVRKAQVTSLPAGPEFYNQAWGAPIVAASGNLSYITAPYRNLEGPYATDMILHKDRMWILMDDRILFSKAADPMTWDVPNGGGFIFIEDNLNAIVSNGDSLAVAGDHTITSVRYTIDPNDINDLNVVQVSSTVGANSLAIHDSMIYFVRDDSLYALSGSSISKVVDLNLGLIEGLQGTSSAIATNPYAEGFPPVVRLLSYKRFLIIQNIRTKYYAKNIAGTITYAIDFAQYPVNLVDASLDTVHKAWFMNMDNGSIHEFSYLDQMDDDFTGGNFSDMAVYPKFSRDGDSGDTLFLSTNLDYDLFRGTPVGTNGHTGFIYFLDPSSTDNNREARRCFDMARVTSNTPATGSDFVYKYPDIHIRIEQFVPDGSEYFMKKFRNLLIEGALPISDNYSLSVGLGINAAGTTTTVRDAGKFKAVNDSMGFHTDPESIRYGVNARSRSISVVILGAPTTFAMWSNAHVLDSPSDPLKTVLGYQAHFMIHSMAVLWSPTARGPVKYSR